MNELNEIKKKVIELEHLIEKNNFTVSQKLAIDNVLHLSLEHMIRSLDIQLEWLTKHISITKEYEEIRERVR